MPNLKYYVWLLQALSKIGIYSRSVYKKWKIKNLNNIRPTFEIKSRAPSLTWLGKEYFTWNSQKNCTIDLISKF